MRDNVKADYSDDHDSAVCTVSGKMGARRGANSPLEALDAACPEHSHWSQNGRDGGKRFYASPRDPKPAAQVVPRRATCVGDLRAGMVVEYTCGRRTIHPHPDRPGCLSARDGDDQLAVFPDDWVMFADCMTIIADPEPAAAKHDDGQPCTGLGCGSSCPKFRARSAEMQAAMWAPARLPAKHAVEYSNHEPAKPACDPRCSLGAPCRGPKCMNALQAAGREAQARFHAEREAAVEAAQEREKAAILAQWRAQETARTLPTVTPWAMLTASTQPWPYASRTGRRR